MKHTDYTLPEFTFFEATSHLGNPLEGRDVLQHIRSYTILEIIALDSVMLMDFSKSQTHEFEYKNIVGIIEKHLFVLHFTLAESDELPEIFAKCEAFYKDYLTWEDNNLLNQAIHESN